MQEIFVLLKKEYELAKIIKEKAHAQQEALSKQRGGAEAGKIAEEILLKLMALSKLSEEQATMLQTAKCSTMAELLARLPESAERKNAEQILTDLQMALKDLERISAVSKKLLAKDMEFAGFTINVLNQVAADTTYAPQGAAGQEPLRGKKMFDQSV